MTWYFHCFSSAKIAIPGRPSLRIPLLGRPTPGIGTLIANDALPHGGCRAAHGALPHGGGKFPGSEGGCGSPFEGPALRMARGSFVARPTRLPKSEEGVGVAKGTQSGTLFALPPGYVIYRTDDRIAPSVYSGL